MWVLQKCEYGSSKYTVEPNDKEEADLCKYKCNHFPQGRTNTDEASSITTSSKEVPFAAFITEKKKNKIKKMLF